MSQNVKMLLKDIVFRTNVSKCLTMSQNVKIAKNFKMSHKCLKMTKCLKMVKMSIMSFEMSKCQNAAFWGLLRILAF